MVARLKLKEIDGRAPPGVNASFVCRNKQDLLQPPERVSGLPSIMASRPLRTATPSNCGELLKPLATAAHRKVGVQHQGNNLGDGKNAKDATMDNPQPSP